MMLVHIAWCVSAGLAGIMAGVALAVWATR
jgi:hypothetical protein